MATGPPPSNKSENKPKPKKPIAKKEQSEPTMAEEYVMDNRFEYSEEVEDMSSKRRRVPSSQSRAKKSYKKKSKKPSYSLKQFKWLIGEWREKKQNGYSVEKWEKSSKNTLKGIGYLVQNGDTSYVESFSIKASRGNLYYISRVESKGKPIKFKLVSFDGQKAIFENKKINFPNQVILEKNHYNNFSTIFQNSNKMNLEQQQNYQNRNQISNERAIRNLSRTRNKK